MSSIVKVAAHGTLLVAEVDDEIAGVVVYLPPGSPRPDIFELEWSIIRMLSVSPQYHNLGRNEAQRGMYPQGQRRRSAENSLAHRGDDDRCEKNL
ncbi:MAG: hypothetical protein ACR2KW_08905 [Rubrobacter sp.]